MRWKTFWALARPKWRSHWNKKNGSLPLPRFSFLFSAFVQRKSSGTFHPSLQNKWILFQITVQSRHNILDYSIRRSSTIFPILLLFVSRCAAAKELSPAEYISPKRHYALRFKSNNDNSRTKHRQYNNRPATAAEWKIEKRTEEGEEKKMMWKIDRAFVWNIGKMGFVHQTERRNAQSSIEMKPSNKTSEGKIYSINKINI